MKLKYLFIFLFIFGQNINAQNSPRIFELNLGMISNYLHIQGGKNIKQERIQEAVDFLEEITKIKCDKNLETVREPSERNYIDWKNWLEINKERIYWDEKQKKIKLKN